MGDTLTVGQAARLLGVHPVTVGRYLDQGLLAGTRTRGGHRRVSEQALQGFLTSRRISGRAKPMPHRSPPAAPSVPVESYSTVDAARLLGVHRFTIARYLDDGVLRGYRTAGGHRRVGIAELARYLRLKGMPVPPELATTKARFKLLVVDADPRALNAIERAFRPHATSVALTATDSGVDAVLLAGGLRPDGVLIDVGVGGVDSFALCQGLRNHPTLAGTQVAMMGANAGGAEAVRASRAGACALFRKPIDPDEVLAVLVPRQRKRR